ncbi:hypothetical protein [Bifidobacterium biavatii]|uniref:Peptidase n=1 Tax=Bifidobacterium biavatii DSM 23969 TaxID=1437608 RepID=A0A086ZN38_9BIFI|nr:hypothetical protein [Bifidobacterium biavatii]KFI47938.1 peptidase [Bifidobacterium biavatii DSM 23969]
MTMAHRQHRIRRATKQIAAATTAIVCTATLAVGTATTSFAQDADATQPQTTVTTDGNANGGDQDNDATVTYDANETSSESDDRSDAQEPSQYDGNADDTTGDGTTDDGTTDDNDTADANDGSTDGSTTGTEDSTGSEDGTGDAETGNDDSDKDTDKSDTDKDSKDDKDATDKPASKPEQKPTTKPTKPAAKPKPEGSVDMYRLYNPNTGEHLYTKNAYERDNLQAHDWSYEGIGWRAPVTSSTPVYRLYNPNAGTHHYTVNGHEKDNLVRHGWRYEGIGWYSSDHNRAYPLYRQYNPRNGAHNYTLNGNEAKQLVSRGWRNEGIAWYGVSGAGKSQATVFAHNVAWAGQGLNNCAPTSGFMIFRAAHKTRSANGTPLSIGAMETYMKQRWDGADFYNIVAGMNNWVGRNAFVAVERPTYAVTKQLVRRSYDAGYAPLLNEGERRGGPHLNGHNNGTFDHAIVVDKYNSYTGTVTIVDPLTPVKSKYSLQWLNDTFLQNSVIGDHAGIIAPR